MFYFTIYFILPCQQANPIKGILASAPLGWMYQQVKNDCNFDFSFVPQQPHGDPKPTIASNNIAANATTSKSRTNHKSKPTKSKESTTTTVQQKQSKSKEPKESPSNSGDATDSVKNDELEVLVVKDPKVNRVFSRLRTRENSYFMGFKVVRRYSLSLIHI